MAHEHLKRKITQLQERLSLLRLRLPEVEKIADLNIADPAMREDARRRIPEIKADIDATIKELIDTENQLHRLTF